MANEDEPITRVLDEEVIFRAVTDHPNCHQCDRHGKLTLKHSAFNDPDHKASVNRALMRPNPDATRRSPEDGVVKLIAVDVRRLSGEVRTNDDKGRELKRHAVDVLHDPQVGNSSHALVVADPHVSSVSTWKRLKEAMCLIANVHGWAAPPGSVRGGGG